MATTTFVQMWAMDCEGVMICPECITDDEAAWMRWLVTDEDEDSTCCESCLRAPSGRRSKRVPPLPTLRERVSALVKRLW